MPHKRRGRPRKYARKIANAAACKAYRMRVKRAAQQQRRLAALQTPPWPDGRYRCLVIDPPWPIDKSPRQVRPHQGRSLDYPTMSLDAIAALPIRALAAEGCHVYLWTTHRF